MTTSSQNCWIYKSGRKNEMYLYLAREDDFDPVPEALLKLFGEATFVIQLELSPQRKLAKEDVLQVMQNLREQGFHLQMPPVFRPEIINS